MEELHSILAGYEKQKNPFDVLEDLCFSPLKQSRRALLFRKRGESPSVTNTRRLKMLWMTEGEVPFVDEGYEFVEVKLARGTMCSVHQVDADVFFFTQEKVL
ncbi:Hypothetical protein BRZCDTV_250 [Brazilian cedratvirus IHUMI]|uniref:Uncharacterized protein n=1 Tax=Brazilian cedratvirus IHUMI TaxID=2126980 RepID=A0A2R8FE51_9VIRU|nr:Hypothetical protein BRZCDTV_250 [Brazilian cedratvirus IHUMI]